MSRRCKQGIEKLGGHSIRPRLGIQGRRLNTVLSKCATTGNPNPGPPFAIWGYPGGAVWLGKGEGGVSGRAAGPGRSIRFRKGGSGSHQGLLFPFFAGAPVVSAKGPMRIFLPQSGSSILVGGWTWGTTRFAVLLGGMRSILTRVPGQSFRGEPRGAQRPAQSDDPTRYWPGYAYRSSRPKTPVGTT